MELKFSSTGFKLIEYFMKKKRVILASFLLGVLFSVGSYYINPDTDYSDYNEIELSLCHGAMEPTVRAKYEINAGYPFSSTISGEELLMNCAGTDEELNKNIGFKELVKLLISGAGLLNTLFWSVMWGIILGLMNFILQKRKI